MLYRATVTRFSDDGLPHVAIPALKLEESGPIESCVPASGLAPGDRVIVARLAGEGGLIIIGRPGY